IPAKQRSKLGPSQVADLVPWYETSDVVRDALAVDFLVEAGQRHGVSENLLAARRPGHVLLSEGRQFLGGVRADVADELVGVHENLRTAKPRANSGPDEPLTAFDRWSPPARTCAGSLRRPRGCPDPCVPPLGVRAST